MIKEIQTINDFISKTNLSLTGYTVLTEVGSNNYLYTPVIAAIAGAHRVYAWTKDSTFGSGSKNIEDCLEICKISKVENVVEFSNGIRPSYQIQEADIVTNSGFIRPINKDFISSMKEDAVISLMFESWELREEDVDIHYCQKSGRKVAGIWENHPLLKVFSGVGPLAIKLSLEAGYEIFQNKIIVWSDDQFGKETVKSFDNMGACEVIMTCDSEELYDNLSGTDFIYVCDYDEKKKYFGDNSIFDLEKMLPINPFFGIVHLYGNVSISELEKYNIKVYPHKEGKPSVMTKTLGYLGATPLLRLQVAGFKVAENMLKDIKCDLAQPVNY
ncbi:MAG: hypothetical protein HOG49_38670 [Candidatus Scalindua sp.]|jgi:hypothetical protein|nr:hypothetical protein [Candidatus Scalindua sp.]